MKSSKNIKEELHVRPEYFTLSSDLRSRIMDSAEPSFSKLVIAIGGESGSGKSTTAYTLEKEFESIGINCITLHMDSYFIRPPKDNHMYRLEQLDRVGPQELNMSILNEHIQAFKANQELITVPVVSYKDNCFFKNEINLSNINILIIEGVYSFLCHSLDYRIFINRTYHETYKNRMKRTREVYDPVIESILEIEHNIVSPMIKDADFIVEKNYIVR